MDRERIVDSREKASEYEANVQGDEPVTMWPSQDKRKEESN